MADEGKIKEIKYHCNFDIKNLIRGEATPVVTQLPCKCWCLFSRTTLYNTYASTSSLFLYVHLKLPRHTLYTNVASNNNVMIFHPDKRFGLLSISQRMEGNTIGKWGTLWPVYPHCVRYWISWSSIVLPLSGNQFFIDVFKISFDWTKNWAKLIKSEQQSYVSYRRRALF